VDDGTGRLRCPYCGAYGVDRMYLASAKLDSCECTACNARWDEERGSGKFRGRNSPHIVVPAQPGG
jgi:transposase-like protein